MELKKNKDNYEVNVFYSSNSKSHYTNIMNKDYNRIAQILIDLYVLGFPIDKAIKVFSKKLNKKDWLGF